MTLHWRIARGEDGEVANMRRRGQVRKIQLIACDLLVTPRWSLPVIEPSHLPARLPLTRAPVYPRVPRKVRLIPLSPQNAARFLQR